MNKELKWMDPSHRGFLTLDISKEFILAKFYYIKELEKVNPEIEFSKSFKIYNEGSSLSVKES
jgi:hypothetical protein